MGEKKKHTLLKIAGTLTATAAVGYAGISAYVFKEIFQTKNSKWYGNAHLVFSDSEMTEWFHHSQISDEYISSYDGVNLHALSLHNHEENGKWIVLCYGPGKVAHKLAEYLYEFDHAGYNVLAVDSRGFGKSEGKYTTLGWCEHYDVISWINYLINRDPNAEITLFGLGIGANAVMNAVGDYLPHNVKCAVEEGGFTEIKDVLRNVLSNALKVDGSAVLPGLNLLIKQMLHFSIYDVSTQRQLHQAKVPMLFVHGEEVDGIPETMLFDNFYACGSERQLMTQQEAEKKYFDTLLEFVQKYTG